MDIIDDFGKFNVELTKENLDNFESESVDPRIQVYFLVKLLLIIKMNSKFIEIKKNIIKIGGKFKIMVMEIYYNANN